MPPVMTSKNAANIAKGKSAGAALARILRRNLAGVEVATEYAFAANLGRRYRFDVALVGPRIAIEIEGGAWLGGAHNRGPRFVRDIEKYGLAFSMGWNVVRITHEDVKTLRAVRWVNEHMAYWRSLHGQRAEPGQ